MQLTHEPLVTITLKEYNELIRTKAEIFKGFEQRISELKSKVSCTDESKQTKEFIYEIFNNLRKDYFY